ncbi:unnamed protein product [Porites lobata]|uniref:Uncharacterized protein n=1 Tax=Porites lobata TaxID=104759 RepID=A0ABN8NLI8_9CNID|nr:unnamed protein product [Porites lobata]
MSRRTQNPWTPESKTGVNYFKHQTKHFLTPYGKTHGLLTSREILDKLYHWNCEWLTRPNYAISELADTIYANLATLADYKDQVFTKHAVDPLLNKARPIRSVLQRFNKKDSATSEEPDERDLRDLMKFVEDDTLKGLCKHLFAASGAMFSVATHIMTLETLFSHPAEYAKRHQKLQQTGTPDQHVLGVIDDNPEEEDPDYEYEDEPEEDIRPPTRRRQRTTILDDEDEENEEGEPFNTPESSAEHALFITQPDPEEYHEPGTLSRAEKGKAPPSRKRPSATSNIEVSIGHALTLCIHTESQNQVSFYPFVLHKISLLNELTLGPLCYHLTDVPPQPNSQPDSVLGLDPPVQ